MTVMENLPDILIVRILAKVGDGLMLLDTLPLVCRRWSRLCRDPEAWAEVDLDWDGAGEDDKVSVDSDDSEDAVKLSHTDAMRLLLHAPALRSLCIDYDFKDCLQQKVLSALCRSRVVVRDTLAVSPEVWTDASHTGRVAVLDTLWRSRGSLRSAAVCLYLEEELDGEVDSDEGEGDGTTVSTVTRTVTATRTEHTGPLTDSQGHTALQVLASLQQLDWLDLDGSSNYPYAGELKNGLPLLRYLTINQGSFSEGVIPERLVLDLIRGATSLRSLDLASDYGRPAVPFLEWVGADRDYCHTASPALLECVAHCADLRHLSAPDEICPFLGRLQHLETLSVDVHPKTEDADVAALVADVLARCRAADAPLRIVSIYVDDVFVDKDDDAARAEWALEQRAKCDDHVKAFEAARPDTSLALHWD